MKKNIEKVLFNIFDSTAGLFPRKKSIDTARIKNILVFEGGGIGDLLWVFPVIESFMNSIPDASLSVLASPAAKETLALFPLKERIKEIIDYDLQGKHQGILNKLRLVYSLRKKQYDLIFSPDRGEGMRERVFMCFLAGIPNRIGFRLGKAGSLNTVTREFKADVPIIKQNLDLLKAAGLSFKTGDVSINIPDQILDEMKTMIHESGKTGKIVTVHPGAFWKSQYKCWPLEKYISLIKIVLEEFKARTVVIGSGNESSMGKKITDSIKIPSLLNTIGQLTIPQMAAVIKCSDLFIGNDSGPLHLALAMRIPAIAILGSTSPDQIINSREHCVVLKKDFPCSPCYVHHYDLPEPCDDIKCLNSVTVEEVIQAIKELI